MASTPQSIATITVFDYEYQPGSATLANPGPQVGAPVKVQLDFSQATSITPQTNLEPIEITVQTDQHGYWQVNLVPNTNINPANTTWQVITPSSRYNISVPSSGPVQSSTIKVGAPTTLAPASSSVGPLTVNGAFTVNTGPVSLPPASVGMAALSGILSIANGGTGSSTQNFVDLTTAQTVAGNKTLSGNTSVGGTLGVTGQANFSADIVAAARLVLSAAAGKIVPGVTSLALRNNADSANNLLVTDLGLATLRNALRIPTTAGGSIISTNYASMPIKIFDSGILGSAQATIDTGVNGIPSWCNFLEVSIYAQSSNASAQFVNFVANSDTSASYYSNHLEWDGTTGQTPAVVTAGASGHCGSATGTGAGGNFASTDLRFIDIQQARPHNYVYNAYRSDGGTAAQQIAMFGGGTYSPGVGAAINQLTFSLGAGSFQPGSHIIIWGAP